MLYYLRAYPTFDVLTTTFGLPRSKACEHAHRLPRRSNAPCARWAYCRPAPSTRWPRCTVFADVPVLWLDACKGACCVEGDLGAPLEEAELQILAAEYASIEPFLTDASRAAIAAQGLYIKDWEGDYSTPTIADRECAYALYDARGILKCGIEQAYLAGATTFKKPISCHLYPIRITKYEGFEALNYDRWSICSLACSFGASLGVRVYQFLQEPLIRKYGAEWYAQLAAEIENPTLV